MTVDRLRNHPSYGFINMDKKTIVVVKGAGEMATGVAWRLHMSHMKIAMTEISKPLAVRRAVSFCEAVYDKIKEVEGVTAELSASWHDCGEIWERKSIPLVVDPFLDCLKKIKVDVLVDATLTKHDNELHRNMASLVIGLGPGFEAGNNAHYVVETKRGHHLGRIYESGRAQANTGVPGEIAGKTWERVLRAPANGTFETTKSISDRVKQGEIVGSVGNNTIKAAIDGILRGLIRPGTQVYEGLKVGDIDPRGKIEYVETISEKARALGGSVLEAIIRHRGF